MAPTKLIFRHADTRRGIRDGRPISSRRRAIVLAAIVACWPLSNVRAQDTPETLEQRVKAAFLYKFAAYVDWPATSFSRPDAPFTIAVAGAEPVAAELAQAVAGRTVNDRPVAVRRLKPGESLDGVHILFVGKGENARLAQLVQNARPRSVLTVTESEGALAQGSVINFVLDDRRVRFEISLDSAEKSRLRLSSRLLAVAQQVHTGTP
jgi:hypothetical protein